ncbi:DUF3883 domain-containing protein [Dactylosporangium sp. NPDC005555]|uniref:protein NO VEIN domain-containing protein n=1 Tax=Dactylosporangium sp. NPDC005555 TaxID=3154889 RepID=UPI00339FC626
MPKGGQLVGRRILVDRDGAVIAAGSGKEGGVAVFLAPQPGDAVPTLTPPPAVAARLVFTHPDLPWRTADANRRLRPGRIWLENQDLLREYRTDAVLDLIGETMRSVDPAAAPDLLACLIFAFDVWSGAAREVAADVVAHAGLLVPVAKGWRPARGAYFGTGWPGERRNVDDLLVRLLRRGAPVSRALTGIAAALIAPPATMLRDGDVRVEALRTFLEHAGVQHGLVPKMFTHAGLALRGDQVADPVHVPHLQIDVPAAQQEIWRAYVARWPRLKPQFMTVPYTPSPGIAVLPGQVDHHAFDVECREIYAELILHGLAIWPDSALQFRYVRGADQPAWPTPLAAFLATSAWLPQTTPLRRKDLTLSTLADAWWIRQGDTPDYLRAQPARYRSLATDRVLERLSRLGTRFWDDPATAAARLQEITDLVQERALGVRSQLAMAVRRAYETAWKDLVATGGSVSHRARPEAVVSRLGRLEVVDLGPEADIVYVADPAGTHKERLLQQVAVLMLPVRDPVLATAVRRLLAATGAEALRSTNDATVSVLLDGLPADDCVYTSLLGEVGPWLTMYVLSVIEFNSRALPPSAAQLAKAADRLGDARLTVAARRSTSVDGHVVPSDRPSQSFLIAADKPPRLAVAGRNLTSMWQIVQAASDAIATLIEMPAAADALRLAAIDLEQRCGPGATPEPADIAAVLGVGIDDVMALMADRDASLAELSRIIPIVACVDPGLANELQGQRDGIDSTEELHEWLTGHGLDADRFVGLAADDDLLAAVRSLGVELGVANANWRALGLPVLHNKEGHARQVAAYLQVHRPRLRDRVRDAFLPVFRTGQSLQDYLRLQHLPGLVADDAWLDRYWEVPEDVLSRHAEAWLHAQLPESGETAPHPVDTMRENNRRALRGILSSARPLVDAWLLRHAPQQHTRPAEFAVVADAMTQAGQFDFAQTSSDAVITWLHSNGQWPAGMPLSLHRAELGLTEAHTTEVRQRLDVEEDERRRAASNVTFGGKMYADRELDLAGLADAVRDSVRPELLDTPTEPAILSEQQPEAEKGSSRASGGWWGGASVGVDPGKTRLIGLTGEIVAAEWLYRQYGVPREESWVSGYRNDILADGKGNDTLGFDFRIVTNERTYLFEVKATTGQVPQFNLGETEVRQAQDLSADEIYTILFVTDVLEPSRCRIIPLPNPFGPAGFKRYRVVGSAMRLAFTMT